MRYGSTPEQEQRITALVDFMGKYVDNDMILDLRQRGFFLVPASLQYHGQYMGGLFDHSMAVAETLVQFTEKLGLEWEAERSPYIVGMFHDLCKMDNYIKTDNGAWEYNSNPIIPGHGEKSVIMLQRYMKLTDEEICCIRWHMGAFDDKENWNRYGSACTAYPNVLYTHTADMVASRVMGI